MDSGRDLIDRLCTAAGMIMEDTVEQAIISSSDFELALRVAGIEQAGRDILILASAAAVISRRREVD